MKKLILPVLQWIMAFAALWMLLFNTADVNKQSISVVTILLFVLAIAQTFLYFRNRKHRMMITAIDQVLAEKEAKNEQN